MHGLLRFLGIAAVAALVGLPSGCGKDDDTPVDEQPVDTAVETPTTSGSGGATEPVEPAVEVAPKDATTIFMKDVLVAWRAGQADNAARMLSQIKWTDPTVFKGVPVLNISEKQFVQLSSDERRDMTLDSQLLGKDLRGLSKHVMTQVDAIVEAGEPDKARRYCQAVIECAARMQGADQLKITQMLGSAMESMAREKLSSLK